MLDIRCLPIILVVFDILKLSVVSFPESLVLDSFNLCYLSLRHGNFEVLDYAHVFLFGFKDDIVIRVQSNGDGSRVDMRSLSRVGGSDFGVNASRVRSFTQKLLASKAD